MTDLITRICEAIFRQEGHPPDHANPGSLRFCPWWNMPEGTPKPKFANGYWVPPSRAAGVAGVAHVVALRIAKGQSLAELISAWAPESDHNNTAAYIANVKQWAAIPDKDAPLWDYLV